jgi:3-methyladenine DNA glycosylase AlkD
MNSHLLEREIKTPMRAHTGKNNPRHKKTWKTKTKIYKTKLTKLNSPKDHNCEGDWNVVDSLAHCEVKFTKWNSLKDHNHEGNQYVKSLLTPYGTTINAHLQREN